ncbi:unnamed protein product [Cylicostephanus goldi]|uniref:Peptidase M12A domain-containing protein n=1 Tax=Cylicostephanus goldi TaxID=71465 RepID=A0A3P6S0N6_CYLGO|nr:unnamed protein product [Cylicostephanus goldi]
MCQDSNAPKLTWTITYACFVSIDRCSGTVCVTTLDTSYLVLSNELGFEPHTSQKTDFLQTLRSTILLTNMAAICTTDPIRMQDSSQPSYLRTLGSRVISFYDIKAINDHYGCSALCGAGSAACGNGGVPNPRNCAACICPNGYGGALCNQRAPTGKRIQIRVTFMNEQKCGTGCRVNSIEPKVIADKRITNPRICCNDMLNYVVTSQLNPTPIISTSCDMMICLD